MADGTIGWTLGDLAALVGGEVEGDPGTRIRRPISAGVDDPEGITFCESADYLAKAEATSVGALILPPGLSSSKPALRHPVPRLAFAKVLALADRSLPLETGIHPTAIVDPGAIVDPDAQIGAYVVVERNAVIEAGAKIYPFCYVGDGCHIGAKATLYPHAVLYKDVSVGHGSIVHSGVVLGADGFGFMWDGQRRFKIPQAGSVELGAYVELGANTTVDRATTGTTSIGTGTKIDNLVQIAHNVTIGEHGAIASQTGIAGSSTLGDRIVMGGQSAVGDHVTITADVTFGGHTGSAKDISEPGAYFGMPAQPVGDGLRSYMMVPKLPDLARRIRELEKKVKELESR
jgi:UDP-3-O-[3-hydroxymyristoyl] glucosamine N-acyltransferase